MEYCKLLNNEKKCLGGGVVIPKSFISGLDLQQHTSRTSIIKFNTNNNSSSSSNSRRSRNAGGRIVISASLVDNPVVWAGRLCVYYALLKSGVAGSPNNPFLSAASPNNPVLSQWLRNIQINPDKEAADKRKLVSKWHPTTKGTLRRNYRIPSKPEGRRLLKAVAALLSQDDHFVDASSHKGCQIRRESAHGESVCCNNVRALFDELPTPHLILEITPFPAGPLTDIDYAKAEKLERVLRSSPSV